MIQLKRSVLPAEGRRLVDLMSTIRFGQIGRFQVRDGMPVLDPPPRVIREVRLGRDAEPVAEHRPRDFVLRAEVLELFRQLGELKDGVVHRIQVKHGLPFSLLLEGGRTGAKLGRRLPGTEA